MKRDEIHKWIGFTISVGVIHLINNHMDNAFEGIVIGGITYLAIFK